MLMRTFIPCIALLASLPCGLGLHRTKTLRGDPAMEDVEEFSKNAETLGEIYKKEADKMPTDDEQRKAVMKENFNTVGSLEEDALAEAESDNAAAASLLSHCPEECDHDYKRLCPEGWSSDDGNMCTARNAPESYSGPCKPSAYFADMSSSGKTRFEERCKVCYPCLKTGGGGGGGGLPPAKNGPIDPATGEVA